MRKDWIKNISFNAQSIIGKTVNERLIVIQSDDWGSVRMSSKQAFNNLKNGGIPVDTSAYNKFDALASEDDLSLLFEVLNSVKDSNGNPAIITANTITANPNFSKIENSGFTKYFFEPFIETMQSYPNHKNAFNLWKEGMESKVFLPQLHGREHLNVDRWMQMLQLNDPDTHLAFKNKVFGFPLKNKSPLFHNYMASFDLDNSNDVARQIQIVEDAAVLFEKIFGFKSETFIAPNYIWHDKIEQALAKAGVNQIQSGLIQIKPTLNKAKYKNVFHWMGESNAYNQRYAIRNNFFEPSLNPSFDWEAYCLKRIEIAFKWHKPAVICSHRLNYIGGIVADNRGDNLKRLKRLLDKIVRTWPDVKFISSNTLSDYLR